MENAENDGEGKLMWFAASSHSPILKLKFYAISSKLNCEKILVVCGEGEQFASNSRENWSKKFFEMKPMKIF